MTEPKTTLGKKKRNKKRKKGNPISSLLGYELIFDAQALKKAKRNEIKNFTEQNPHRSLIKNK